ncbi:hypothetical protein GF324_05755 [bacterium]|nr:hypothetical protein [bacterium]
MQRFPALILVALIVVALAGPTMADTKIGIIISAKILDEYPEAIEAQKTLESEIAEWQRQARQKEEELIALEEELGQEAAMFFSEERRTEKEEQYRSLLQEYRSFQRETERKARQRNEDLFAPINEKIQKIIDQIAAEENFDIIFDAVGSSIAYLGDPSLDITDRVLEELMKQQ